MFVLILLMFSVQELQARSLQVVKACHNQTSSLWFEPNFIYCDFLCAHCVKAVWWITSESDLCAFREWNLNSLKSIQQKNMCTLIFFLLKTDEAFKVNLSIGALWETCSSDSKSRFIRITKPTNNTLKRHQTPVGYPSKYTSLKCSTLPTIIHLVWEFEGDQ